MQAVSMEAEDASSTCAVTQLVGDNIDLNIVSIYGNTPFHSMGLVKTTSPETPSADNQMSAVKRVNLKALNKAKILKRTEVEILPFKHETDWYKLHRIYSYC